MRVGMAKREDAGAGQSRINFHEPRVPDDQYLSWQYTSVQSKDWSELFLSYGNSWVKGTVGFQGFNFTDGSFQNTGVGMDQEALGRIFEPYFSTKATGTGLGLTIAKRNIELNGGTVDVASERGVGTTVTIRLPVVP